MTNITKIYCNTCRYETKHDIKSIHERSYQEIDEHEGREFLGYYEDFEYRFLVCRGCDTATLEEKSTGAGLQDNDGNNIYYYSYYPPRKNFGFRSPKQFLHIDKKLNQTYKEIITAYQQGLGIVTSMGIRALLEGICVIEGIDDKKAWGLGKKIDKLKVSARIPESIIDGLKGLKFIGDDAAHRLKTTEKHHLSLAVDLIEALLTNLYEAKFDLEKKANLVNKAHSASIEKDLP
ncbi:DUF4145 domain-containing protein [Desulfobacter vibrioformis]|uniref:DUF4145 domain-containing protein n=1 Tax=Desulfobacter vibrioformis TaxID=34031 RepID=UPI0005512E73|nr:DUF4145 domain-containing protein [Desulfobacter vibrioformis]